MHYIDKHGKGVINITFKINFDKPISNFNANILQDVAILLLNFESKQHVFPLLIFVLVVLQFLSALI
jgi:hypothetical protein